jgi:peroxiredoxin
MGPSPLERASLYHRSRLVPPPTFTPPTLPVFALLLLACLAVGVLNGCGNRNPADNTQGTAAKPAGASSAETARDTAAAVAETPHSLEPRMPFPDVGLVTLDGEKTSTRALLDHHDSLVIFIRIGCESCEEVMAIWKNLMDTVPPEMNIIAVTWDEPKIAADYVKKTGFPFPLYCDERGIFDHGYKMGVYPSMIGVPEDGRIAYIGRPVTGEFTPVKAWKMLMDVKEKRKAAGL